MRLVAHIASLLALVGLSQPAPLAIRYGGPSAARQTDLDGSSFSSVGAEFTHRNIQGRERDAHHTNANTLGTHMSEGDTQHHSAIQSRQVTLNMILGWFENAGITLEDVLEDHGLRHAH